MSRTTRPLTPRDYDVLECLEAFHRNMEDIGSPEAGARPMDVGAWDASHHSATLKKLERRGLVRSLTKWSGLTKRSGSPRKYWLEDAGRVAVQAWRDAGRPGAEA